MKQLLTLYVVLTCSLYTFAQSPEETKIVHAYGEVEYNQMLTSNPGQVELLEKYILHGFHLVPSNDKYLDFPELTEIPLRSKLDVSISIENFMQSYDSGNFNPLLYRFFPSNEIQIFRLQGTNRVVLIDSQSSILAH